MKVDMPLEEEIEPNQFALMWFLKKQMKILVFEWTNSFLYHIAILK